MKSYAMSLVGLAGLACLVGFGPVESRKAHTDRVHDEFKALFEDMSLVEKGMLGVSRLETLGLDAHGGGRPKSAVARSTDWRTIVEIYGAKGAPLSPTTITVRYHNWMASGSRMSRNSIDSSELARQAVKKLAAGEKGPFIAKSDETEVDLRPIRLSKKECLSCHKGMKLNDPVALLAVWTAPKPKPKR